MRGGASVFCSKKITILTRVIGFPCHCQTSYHCPYRVGRKCSKCSFRSPFPCLSLVAVEKVDEYFSNIHTFIRGFPTKYARISDNIKILRRFSINSQHFRLKSMQKIRNLPKWRFHRNRNGFSKRRKLGQRKSSKWNKFVIQIIVKMPTGFKDKLMCHLFDYFKLYFLYKNMTLLKLFQELFLEKLGHINIGQN